MCNYFTQFTYMQTPIFFNLEDQSGFFSTFLFLLLTYTHLRKMGLLLCIKDDKWRFLYEKGFDDYFTLDNRYVIKYSDYLAETKKTHDDSTYFYHHSEVPAVSLTLNEYKLYSSELYNIRPEILDSFNLNFLPEKYNSIFMRGGDKLLWESTQHDISLYVNFLLEKNECNTPNVFVHSDDNLLVEAVEKYIKDNNIDLKVFKITDQQCNGGTVTIKYYNFGNCKDILCVDDMTNEQKKTHMLLMLKAIEIMRKSQNVVCSFDTNVSKFMKINFDCNVYSINHVNDIDFDAYTPNPAYAFSTEIKNSENNDT